MKRLLIFMVFLGVLNALDSSESSRANWDEILQDSTKAAQKLLKDIESKGDKKDSIKDSIKDSGQNSTQNPAQNSNKDSKIDSTKLPKVEPTKLPKVTPTKSSKSSKTDSINVPSIEIPSITIPEINVPESNEESSIESKRAIKLADSNEIQKAPYIPSIRNVEPLRDSNFDVEKNIESKVSKSPESKIDSKIDFKDSTNKDSKSKAQNPQDSKQKITESKTQNPKTDSIKNKKLAPNIRDTRDDFNINNESNLQDVEITQMPKEQNNDSSLQIEEQEYTEQLPVQKHDVEVKKRLPLDPLFVSQRTQIGGGYHSMLALGDTQTLIYNGAFVDFQLPLNLRIFALNIYASASLGKADTSAQSGNTSTQYFSASAGAKLSIPLTRKYVVTHALLGGEYGLGIRGSAINEINGFGGIDFVYNDFVFRPYLGANFYFFNLESLQSGVAGGISGYLGFKTFYSYKRALGSFSVAIYRDFLRPSGGVFLIMPIQNNALYLGTPSTSIEANFGIDMAASRHFLIKGSANVTYNLSYYNITALIKISAYFRF